MGMSPADNSRRAVKSRSNQRLVAEARDFAARYPEVNAVTAIDNGQLASYANRGSFVTLGAPGTSVVSYDNQTWSVAGTSASAAYTSGIAAAYLEANPCSTPSSIQSYLRSNLGVKITTSGQ